jgi:nitroreductase
MDRTLETILTRTSIRKFQKAEIPEDALQLMLSAAMSAPSACNQKPWHFVVVTGADQLEALSAIHSGTRFVRDAALAIVVFGDPASAILSGYWRDDCAAATENLLLAAHALGFGGTWIGVDPADADTAAMIRGALFVPDRYVPFSVAALGQPAEEKEIQDRYIPERVHKGRW